MDRNTRLKINEKLLLESVGITPNLMFAENRPVQMPLVNTSNDEYNYLEYGYTNDILKEKVKEIFLSYKLYRNVGKLFCSLIDRDIVYPVFTKDNTWDAIIFQNLPYFKQDKATMGFFDTKKNNIVLLLDNLGNAIGNITDTKLFELISHEIIHYFFSNFPGKALKLFLKPLIYFYNNLLFMNEISNREDLKDLLSKYKDKDFPNIKSKSYLTDIISALLKYEISKSNIIRKKEQQDNDATLSTIVNKYSELPQGSPIRTFIDDLESIDLFPAAVKLNRNSKIIFIEAYKRMIKKFYTNQQNESIVLSGKLRSLFYQELFFPSEVISFTSGYVFEQLFSNQLPIENTHPSIIAISNIINNNRS